MAHCVAGGPLSASHDDAIALYTVTNPYRRMICRDRWSHHRPGRPLLHPHDPGACRGGHAAALGVDPGDVRRVAVCQLFPMEVVSGRDVRGRR